LPSVSRRDFLFVPLLANNRPGSRILETEPEIGSPFVRRRFRVPDAFRAGAGGAVWQRTDRLPGPNFSC
jgi:hypothetical protein